MTTKVNKLVEQNKNLVYFVIRKWFKTKAEDEDFFQEGFIGLWEAAKSYDDTKGRFSTYAVSIIKNKLYDVLRRENCIKRKSDNVIFISFNDDSNKIEEEIGDGKEYNEQLYLREIWKELEEQDRVILQKRIALKTINNIADNLNISERTTKRRLKKAREKFIEKYNKEMM